MGYDDHDLKVVVEGEVTAVGVFGLSASLLGNLLGAVHDTSLLVVGDALLEEVGLATERNVLHEVKGVGRLVDLLVAESDK